MIHPAKGTNTVRAVFIVCPNGNIRAIMYYPQELGRNIDEIMRAVRLCSSAMKRRLQFRLIGQTMN